MAFFSLVNQTTTPLHMKARYSHVHAACSRKESVVAVDKKEDVGTCERIAWMEKWLSFLPSQKPLVSYALLMRCMLLLQPKPPVQRDDASLSKKIGDEVIWNRGRVLLKKLGTGDPIECNGEATHKRLGMNQTRKKKKKKKKLTVPRLITG